MKDGKQALIVSGVFLLLIGGILAWRSLFGEPDAYPAVSDDALFRALEPAEGEDASYIQWIRSDDVSAYADAAEGIAVTIRAADYAQASADADLQVRRDDRLGEDVVDWLNADGWIEWEADIPEDGLYQVMIRYAPLEGGYNSILRGLEIDGAYPFREAKRLALDRLWKDAEYPYRRNKIGNEVRPVQVEEREWTDKLLADYSAASEPLRFALAKGRHTIRLVGVREPVALHSIEFVAPYRIPGYAEYAAEHAAHRIADTWYAQIEAERFAVKTSPSVRTISVSEAFASPDPRGRIVYNALGGTSWRNPGESVIWEVTVPKSGLYAVDLKYFQGYNGNAAAFRTIKLDGKIPFAEMMRYAFPPNSSMEVVTLSDADGSPYLFYLTEGTHRFEMTVDNSVIRPVILALFQINERLTEIEQTVRVVSGNYGYGGVANMDTTRVWEMTRYDPEIETKLVRLRGDLQAVSDYLKGLYGGGTDSTAALDGAVSRIGDMLEDVNNLPNEFTAFSEIKSNINAWTQTIENQPLHLDYLVVRTPETDPHHRIPNGWDRLRFAAVNFFRTFVLDYDTNDYANEEALTVWVQRGRDYVDLLQAMIDEEFTPRTGIEVNVSLIPNQNMLLMSAAAGHPPDVALGFGMEVPADFAMRGAAADLTQFPGFEDVVQRFNPGVMRTYMYDGGVYALPETVTYNMMFVRTDILEELGLEPPETWEDVLDILPTLQENAMTFMYPKISTLQLSGTAFMTPKPDFITPYYQHGAEFYTPDGLLPRIGDEAGYAAFKEWVDWYGKYNLPRDVPEFFNHFRFGGMPVGVGDINTYIQLMTAAPELAGSWIMLPIPGVEGPDGTVERWTSQGVASAMILEASGKKDKAWAFLDWWTSDDVQSRYARDIESLAGIAYRWQTANVNAFQTLPWEERELAAINEQWRWAKNMPFVPGYYLLPRVLEFAWNDVLLSGIPPREALDEAEMTLMREMMRKQVEFGIEPGDDLQIAPYTEPYTKPAERSQP
jgi:ABC-type glycerol-3-phosphate transport system substrate-binding protein